MNKNIHSNVNSDIERVRARERSQSPGSVVKPNSQPRINLPGRGGLVTRGRGHGRGRGRAMSPLVLDRDRDDNMADITESDIAAMEDEVADSNSESLADRLLLAYRAALTQPHTPKLNPLEQPGNRLAVNTQPGGSNTTSSTLNSTAQQPNAVNGSTGLNTNRSTVNSTAQANVAPLNRLEVNGSPVVRILAARRLIQLLNPPCHPSISQ
jgi:hypothetical protein